MDLHGATYAVLDGQRGVDVPHDDGAARLLTAVPVKDPNIPDGCLLPESETRLPED